MSGLSRRYSVRLSASLLCLDLRRDGQLHTCAHTLWPRGSRVKVRGASLLFTHGAVLHEVADLATDAAAAVIWGHLPFSEDFRVEEVLLRRMKDDHVFLSQSTVSIRTHTQAHTNADTDHKAGVDRREGFERRAEHPSSVDEGLHDEVGHWREEMGVKRHHKDQKVRGGGLRGAYFSWTGQHRGCGSSQRDL